MLDGTHLRFVHRRAAAARYLETVIQYDTDLTGPWSDATDGIGGVTIDIQPDFFGNGIDRVETRIPLSLAPDDRMFVRLKSRE